MNSLYSTFILAKIKAFSILYKNKIYPDIAVKLTKKSYAYADIKNRTVYISVGIIDSDDTESIVLYILHEVFHVLCDDYSVLDAYRGDFAVENKYIPYPLAFILQDLFTSYGEIHPEEAMAETFATLLYYRPKTGRSKSKEAKRLNSMREIVAQIVEFQKEEEGF